MAIVPEVIVGFEDEAKILIDRLVHGSSKLEIIPIVGMAGLGKTTFAKKVYNTLLCQNRFHIQLWCTVSQVYHVKKLLLDLLCSDGENRKENEALSDDVLLDKLRKKLLKNKYFIVFDDVWNNKAWNDLRLAFSDDKNGSRIIFTSRFSNVASQLEHGCEPHNLRLLTDRQSWDLLQKRVFGENECPIELHDIGKELANNCKGLPLSVVIIAGILANTPNGDWDKVAKRLTRTTVYDTDECKNTLELSYRYLPPYLKPCFLYFGAFPEDAEIRPKKLIQLWMAEGFVENTDGKRLEDLAEEYLMELIGRNLVMVGKQSCMGGVKTCHIHDLLHEFCKVKAKEENRFLEVLQGYEELSTFDVPANLIRLSIWSTAERFKELPLYCPQLSTLLVFSLLRNGNFSRFDDVSPCFPYPSLRVLGIEDIFLPQEVLPREIVSFVHLRYLAIQGMIMSIPFSISELSNLETFIWRAPGGVCSLPYSFWTMSNLRHLHVRGYYWDSVARCSLPTKNSESNSGLLNLDTISYLAVFTNQRVEDMVKNIPNVRQLKIALLKAKKSTVTSSFDVSGLETLESLTLYSWTMEPIPRHVEFSFPLTLKKLVLGRLMLPWSKITLIEELPNLEVLKLGRHSFAGDRWVLTEGGFRKLRFLALKDLDINEWTDTDSDDDFPRLQKLKLFRLQELKSMPSCFKQIAALEVIEVRECASSIKDLVGEIEEEQKSSGNECLRIIANWDLGISKVRYEATL